MQILEKNMLIMMEQFNLMRSKWEEQERERKCKGMLEQPTPESTLNSGITHGVESGSREKGEVGDENWSGEVRNRRLEMSIFSGDNLDEWMFRAKRYFEVNRLTKLEKIETTMLCFEGGALAWYQWERWRRGFRSWE